MNANKYLSLLSLAALVTLSTSCLEEQQAVSTSGASKKTVEVVTDGDGWTVEQRNVAERLKRDNIVGAIKHLYIISPYSGQVILYSTVKGKVTSSGKRLTPTSVSSVWNKNGNTQGDGFYTDFGGQTAYTKEVLQDDGTYGSSCEYIYWFDSRNIYHSHFFTGGQIIHVSDQPLPVKNITINLEQQ